MKVLTRLFIITLVILAVITTGTPLVQAQSGTPVKATKNKNLDLVLLPKFLGILPFDQAHQGAEEAMKELDPNGKLEFLGPTPDNSVAGQIEIIKSATTRGVNGIMISNNAGDQLVPATK